MRGDFWATLHIHTCAVLVIFRYTTGKIGRKRIGRGGGVVRLQYGEGEGGFQPCNISLSDCVTRIGFSNSKGAIGRIRYTIKLTVTAAGIKKNQILRIPELCTVQWIPHVTFPYKK